MVIQAIRNTTSNMLCLPLYVFKSNVETSTVLSIIAVQRPHHDAVRELRHDATGP